MSGVVEHNVACPVCLRVFTYKREKPPHCPVCSLRFALASTEERLATAERERDEFRERLRGVLPPFLQPIELAAAKKRAEEAAASEAACLEAIRKAEPAISAHLRECDDADSFLVPVQDALDVLQAALDRFDAAYIDVAQAARRVLLLAEGDEREAFARVAHSMAALPARPAAPAQAPKFSGDADERDEAKDSLRGAFTPDLFEVGASDTSIAPVRLAAASLAEFLADWEERGKKKTLGELRLLCREVGRALLDAGEE